jgi:hypothetical protein
LTGIFKKEDWLAVVIYPLVVVLMEAFWIYPWVVWMGLLPSFDQIRPPLSMLSVITVLRASLTVTRVFHKREWGLGRIRAAIIGGGFVVMFLVRRVEYGGGYRSLDGGYERPLSAIGLYALTFFLFGLTALAIRNIYKMRKRMTEKETQASAWRSLPLILAVIGGIVVVGLLAATLFSPEFLDTIAMGLKILGNLLKKALYYIAYPIKYLAAAVFWVLQWLVNLIRRPQEQVPLEIQGSTLGEIERESREMSEIISTILEALAIAALVAAVIFILAKAIRRIRVRTDDDGFDETHESLWSKDTPKNDLRQLLKTIRQKFQRSSKSAGLFYNDEAGDLKVREIYKRLLMKTN